MNEREKTWKNVDKKQKAREKMPKFVIKFLAFSLDFFDFPVCSKKSDKGDAVFFQ
ncbi:MAG: hypothetical protein V8R75_12080 [Oscillospiraceae bacterium]